MSHVTTHVGRSAPEASRRGVDAAELVADVGAGRDRPLAANAGDDVVCSGGGAAQSANDDTVAVDAAVQVMLLMGAPIELLAVVAKTTGLLTVISGVTVRVASAVKLRDVGMIFTWHGLCVLCVLISPKYGHVQGGGKSNVRAVVVDGGCCC